jgi:hypothetical protein
MNRRVTKNAEVLRALFNADNAVRAAVIRRAKKELVLALVDVARAIINRVVPLTDAQLRSIARRARDIKALVNPRTSIESRKELLQKGGFITALLAPALKLLPTLLGGLTSLLSPKRRR